MIWDQLPVRTFRRRWKLRRHQLNNLRGVPKDIFWKSLLTNERERILREVAAEFAWTPNYLRMAVNDTEDFEFIAHTCARVGGK